MKKLLSVVLLVLFLGFVSIESGFSADYQLGEVIVSASKTEEYVGETGSSVSVISQEMIQQKKYKTVLDALKSETGISVASSGTFGGTSSVFMRGADSSHTLVLYDGIRLYDPISTSASYDLANLTLDNVERIEILRGPQSSLYGSSAMGGVINIITKKGQGKPQFTMSSEIASKETYTERLGVSGSSGKLHYSVEGSRLDSDGISKARDGAERDSQRKSTGSAKFSYDVNENLEIGAQALYLFAKTDIDDGAYEDDPNKKIKYENFVSALFANHRVNDVWDYGLKYSWLRNVRQNFDPVDAIDTFEFPSSWFKGWSQDANWQNNIDLGSILSLSENKEDTFIAGFQYNHELGQTNTSGQFVSKNRGYFIENRFALNKKLFNTVAIRIDKHSRFGLHTTGRSTLSYLFDTNTRLKASYGTGFKAPSLFQLFSTYGKPGLSPEEMWGYDAGVEQYLFDGKLKLDSTFFFNRFKNLVDFNLITSKYDNILAARTIGNESGITYQPIKNLVLKYSFTYTEARDLGTKFHLVRRPNNKHNFNINYQFLEDFNLNLDVTRNTKIYDSIVFGSIPGKLKDYTVANVALSYDVNDKMDVYLKVENLFDETYQEVNGYANLPRFVRVGVNMKF